MAALQQPEGAKQAPSTTAVGSNLGGMFSAHARKETQEDEAAYQKLSVASTPSPPSFRTTRPPQRCTQHSRTSRARNAPR